jgi:hypothetical protein
VAAVNALRGERSLAFDARIRLRLRTGPRLRAALEKHAAYLKNETLAVEVAFAGPVEAAGKQVLEAGGEAYAVDFVEA